MSNLPPDIQQLIQAELKPFERVRWAGQPTVDNLPLNIYTFVFVFGLFWTAFAIFWTLGSSGLISILGGGESGFFHISGSGKIEIVRLIFACFGIPFILIGLWMLSRPFTAKKELKKLASRTAYVVTDRRAIIIDGGFYKYGLIAGMMPRFARSLFKYKDAVEIQSFEPDQLKNIKRVQRADGTGDIVFQELQELVSPGDNSTPRMITRQIGFLNIYNPAEVERLIREIDIEGPPPAR